MTLRSSNRSSRPIRVAPACRTALVIALLTDAEQLVLHLGGALTRRPCHGRNESDRRARRRPLAELAQRGGEVVCFEDRRPEIPNRLARFANVGLDVPADSHQLIPRGRRRTVQGVGDRIELQGDADEALEQRIVNLSTETRPFDQHQRKFAPHAVQANSPGARHHQRDDTEGRGVEPGGLVKGRLDREVPGSGRREPRCRSRSRLRRGSGSCAAKGSYKTPGGVCRRRPNPYRNHQAGNGSGSCSRR